MKVKKQTHELLANPDATLAELNLAYDNLVHSAIEQGYNPDNNAFVQTFAARVLEAIQIEGDPIRILADLDRRREKARGRKGPEELAHIAKVGKDFGAAHPHEAAFDLGMPVVVDRGLVLTGEEVGARVTR